ncbi:hypothetical protein IJH02_01930 [Candidatus Saccharibacteria bacterium]|nr:hypothetical protein [Candidatus Saccharibacteria bacterium]
MRVVCLYKRETDYGREVEDYLNDIGRMPTKSEIEAIDPETIDGEIMARARDIVRYPAILALDGNGSVVQEWIGLPLPPIDEVVYYLNS